MANITLTTSTKRLRLLVADEQPLLRDAFIALLSPIQELEVTSSLDGIAEDALVGAVERGETDVVLLGTKRLTLQHIDTLAKVQEVRHGIGIALLPATIDSDIIATLRDICMRRGAGFGLMLKSSLQTSFELRRLIDAVNERRVVVDPAPMDQLVSATTTGRSGLASLSPREREVLGFMAKGYHNAAIATTLHVERATVDRYIHNIYGKMEERPPLIHPRAHAVRLYHQALAENGAMPSGQAARPEQTVVSLT